MITIRPMAPKDAPAVFSLMQAFFASDAVQHHAPDRVLKSTLKACLAGSPYIEGFVFAREETVVGYAMASKSFSTEFGGLCVWVEDIFIQKEYRSRGAGARFLGYLEERYPNACRFRLEVEKSNGGAVRVYERCGYSPLPYIQMSKEIQA